MAIQTLTGMGILYLKRTALLIVVFFANLSAAQGAQLDVLLNALNTSDEDTIRINKLLEISEYYLGQNPDSAIYFAREAEKESSKANYASGAARAKINEGIAKELQNNYNAALLCYNAALSAAEGMQNEVLDAEIRHLLGELHMNRGRFREAAGFLLDALEKFTKADHISGIIRTKISLGNLFLFKEEPSKALEYFNKTALLATDDPILQTQIEVHRGMAYQELQMPDSAQLIYLNVLEVLQKNAMKRDVGNVLNRLGDLHYNSGNYKTALGYYKHALGIKQEFNEKEGLFYSYNALGRIYALTKNPINAMEHASAALTIAESLQNKNSLMEVYKTMGIVHEQINEHEPALRFYKLHQAYKDSIYSIEKEKAVANLAALHDLARSEKEMALLKKENEFRGNLNSYQQIFLIIAAIVILFILGIAILLYRTNKSREKLHQRLKFKTEAIGKQNSLLVKQKEEIVRQRDKIQVQADNLREMDILKNKLFSIIGHDLRSPFSQLKGMFLLLEMKKMKPDLAEELLHGIKKNVYQLNGMLENLLAWAKSQMDRVKPLPAEINVYDLADNCRELFAEAAATKEVKIKNKINKKLSAFADPDMTELVIRNIMSNAVKFCNKGDSITLSSEENEEEITISVRDTGVGMNKEALDKLFSLHNYTTLGTNKEKGTGLGMHLCHEFVKQNGGRIWVASEPEAGTTFFFTIPAAPKMPLPELAKAASEKVAV